VEQEITKERLKELLDTERKLRALEVAGVDNWDGYDFVLESIRKEEEYEEFLESVLDGILSILAPERYEPSERGAGWAITPKRRESAICYLRSLSVPIQRRRSKWQSASNAQSAISGH